MDAFNWMMTGLFRILFYPFRALEPIWALTVISFLTGILALWLFGKVSDQETIKVVRDRIRGNIMGIRIFGDDIGLLFLLQGRVLRQTLTYLRHAFMPLIVMLIPLMIIFIQLNLWFSYRPLRVDETATVKATYIDHGPSFDEPITIEAGEGIVVETPGVHIPSKTEVAWRIRAVAPGEHTLSIQVGDHEPVEKKVVVGGRWGAVSTIRAESAGVRLLWPGEKAIDERTMFVESIEVLHPPLDIRLFGWGVDWILFFLVASLVFGFAFKGVLGVEI